MIGNDYGALSVIGYQRDSNRAATLVCRCECGRTRLVRRGDLLARRVKLACLYCVRRGIRG